MKNFFKKYRLSFDPLTITNIIIGLTLTINPLFSTKFICTILGIACLIWGLVNLIKFFAYSESLYHSKFDTAQAVIGIILGFTFFFGHRAIASILPVIIGITIIFQSISKIRLALFQKRSGAQKWMLGFVLNILGVILGVSLVFNPFGSFLNIIRLVGIVLLINGITRLFTDFLFAKEMDKINREADRNIIDVEYKEV